MEKLIMSYSADFLCEISGQVSRNELKRVGFNNNLSHSLATCL